MKIGILALAAGRQAGGPETYEVELIRGLAKLDRENEYFVYCTSPEAVSAIGVRQDNFKLRALRPSWRVVSVSWTLPRWMASDGLDFFHSTYAPPPLPNKPFLFTMHCVSNFVHPEFYPTFIRWRLNALQKVGLRRAASVLCVSSFVSGKVREMFNVPTERLHTIHNGVGPEFFYTSPEIARQHVADQLGIDYPYVLYVGKLQARKNVIGLIRAYARYRRESNSPAKLLLVGRKVETSEGIDATIEELGLQREVVQLGYLPPPSDDPESPLPYLYSAARMFVLPSFYEGFGIPILEAMACGCPVITSNATSLPEVAGNAALIVSPHSTEELAEAMVRIDSDAETRTRLIELGIQRARQLTWENCARETLNAYRRFAGG